VGFFPKLSGKPTFIHTKSCSFLHIQSALPGKLQLFAEAQLLKVLSGQGQEFQRLRSLPGELAESFGNGEELGDTATST